MQLTNLILLLLSCFAILESVLSIKVSAIKRYDNFHLPYLSDATKSDGGGGGGGAKQGYSGEGGSGGNDKGKGYNIGGGLRSIAQGSAEQANSAVAHQHSAAIQAAYVAKSTLAQSAAQSASTALAALAGKEVYYNSLQLQREDAEKVLESEILFLQSCKRAVAASIQTANLAKNQANILAASVNGAQNLVENAEISVKESTAQLATQNEMVGKAKNRLGVIDRNLQSVRVDFEATKKLAREATQSAQAAQSNVLSAGNHGDFRVNNHGSGSGNSGYVEGYGSELGGHHYIV